MSVPSFELNPALVTLLPTKTQSGLSIRNGRSDAR